MAYSLHSGDAVTWARGYSGPLFHALLCDAPYEMGFMGKDWDGSGVAFRPETWKAFARVLFPGAFLFVMAGTINDDLISVSMREAGLRKFHKVMGWAYGSGFPKASRVDTQIDKAAGAEREIVGSYRVTRDYARNGKRGDMAISDGDVHGTDLNITLPATPLAQVWEGHRYGLQALKPAIETILIFQKPYEGKPIDNITQTGAGALNIDGGRIEGTKPLLSPIESENRNHPILHTKSATNTGELSTVGRWPSNFLLLDPEAARALDEQSGVVHGGGNKDGLGRRDSNANGVNKNISYGKFLKREGETNYPDSGGASRFFFRVSDQIDEADPVFYCAKASRREREEGLEDLALQGPGQRYGLTKSKEESGHGPHKHNPTPNPHPTVKPLSLTQYLATLLLPPPEYSPRRLFVPFAGVASEMIGGFLAGWEEIEGVELTEEYIPIRQSRLNYYASKPRQLELK